MTQRILMVDDDADLRHAIRDFLLDEGYAVEEAGEGEAVLAAFAGPAAHRPDLVLMDIRLPGKSGLDILRELRPGRPMPLPVMVVTAYGSSSVAIEAIQLGAYDYVVKPFDLDDLAAAVTRFFDWQALSAQVDNLASQLVASDPADTMIGSSPAMQEVYKTIGRVAASDATVLITGETGTGKELVATLLHRRSGYAKGPLVKVNCAALPETLLESELFGHEKGAFTSAIAQRKGRFELANKGTIFLDELGEMSMSTQTKLLRVLQEREFERVGGSTTVKVDCRVVGATNKILPDEIAAGRFREDLFYRLNVIAIHLPPLRERREDIPLLVEHFLHKHRPSASAQSARVSIGALAMLQEHSWPGNIRELQNVVERAVVLSRGGAITEEHIDFTGMPHRPHVDLGAMLREGRSLAEIQGIVERQACIEVRAIAHGDDMAAAAMLGIPVDHFRVVLRDDGRHRR